MLWLAIDPLITLKRLDNIDDGYDLTGTYVVNMEKYKPYHPKYEWENNSDSVVAENFMNLYAIVRSLPEVESYCFTSRFSGSPGDNSAMMYGPVHKEIISNEELTHEKANDKGTYFSGYLSFNIDGSDIFIKTVQEVMVMPCVRNRPLVSLRHHLPHRCCCRN